MEDLYASVLSWGMADREYIPFPESKAVEEYRDLVDPNSLLANVAAVFQEVVSLLNYLV